VTGQERIIVTVRPDGTVDAETRGMLGERCLDAVALLEDFLDAQATRSNFTTDRYRTAVTENNTSDQTLTQRLDDHGPNDAGSTP
jgi:hypothetical protein